MICSKCQFENPEGEKNCRVCGAQLTLVCPGCGSGLVPSDRFCSYCGQKLEMAETSTGTPWSSVEVGRKQATVLFSDLLGYTAISGKMDPEDVRDLMSQIFGEISQVVTKYEGYIDRFIGDAALAIFGIPKAHEDDAVRAVRAAREIHDLVSHISRKFEAKIGLPLVMHTGIDTGLIVTDELGNSKGRYSITGDTINLASRLSDLAGANEILVSPDTYLLSEGYFTFHDLGLTYIKGKEKPVRVYRLLSVREKPITVHRLSGLKADLIGRDEEICQFWEALGRLREGKGSIFSIYGDAGTGKSRLIEEFKATLDLGEIQWIEGHAYDYCQNIPYFPIIDAINRVWQITEGDSPENIREKVESGIERTIGKSKDIIPCIGGLYSLSYPELEGIDPEFWKNCLYKAILEILSVIVQRRPTVFFIEDLHWADPSSLELVRYVSTELRYPALFLFAYRPYFNLFASHQLTALGNSYQEIEIRDLLPTEAQEMMGSLLKTKAIPAELRRFIQEKVEGNPFYLEEVINSLIESETLIPDNGDWKLTKSLDEYNLSRTIQGIISARVDCLEKEVKRTLQEASVIGRAFLYRILQAAKEFKEHIDQDLNELERLDLIRMKSVLPDVEYIFKHALTQEIVYQGLLKKEREEIHQRIGNAIEKIFPNRLPEFYESLAFHFKQSPSILKAFDYLEKSGEKCIGRYALEEAHHYFREALELLKNKPNKSKEEEKLLIDLLIKWGIVFQQRGDWRGLTELFMAYKNTVESFGDKARLGMFYMWLGLALNCQQRCKEAYQYLHVALRLGEEVQDLKVIAHARAFLAWACPDVNLIEEGILHGEKAIEIVSQLSLPAWEEYLYAQCLGGAGYAYWHRGNKAKVMEKGDDLIKISQRHPNITHLMCNSTGHWMKGFAYELDGDFQSSIECCKKAIQVSQHPWTTNLTRSLLGPMYVYYDHFQAAEDTLRQVINYSDKFGCEIIGTPSKIYVGISMMAQGHMEQGWEIVEEAEECILECERKHVYGLIECIRGKFYLQIVQRAAPISLSIIMRNIGFLMKNVPFADRKAEKHLNNAIEITKEIGAQGTLGMAYLDLGLLHKTKGRTGKARECLSEAIKVFEKCEIETYLKQAREALASMG